MKGGLSDQEQERHRPRQRSAVGQEVPLPSQAPTDCCPFRKRSLAGVCAYSRENPGPGGRGGANGGRRPSKLPAKYGPPQSRRLLRENSDGREGMGPKFGGRPSKLPCEIWFAS